jgi:hypothetical protein
VDKVARRDVIGQTTVHASGNRCKAQCLEHNQSITYVRRRLNDMAG